MQNIKIVPAGDSSLLVAFEQKVDPEINRKITSVVRLIRDQHIEGIVDLIPSYCALLINYDPRIMSYEKLNKRIQGLMKMEVKSAAGAKRVFEIPVCYGGEFGPDLQTIADHAGMTPEEVIAIHTSCDYLIYMLGFLPGFCYLGGLDERIHTPRLAEPRIKIPAGSVGIGGSATGIYPLDSPGGWQLMGNTPVKTFDADREVPILLQAGDYIRFVPISEEEYAQIKAQVDANTYECVVREEV